MTSSILSGIANPTIANVPAAVSRGRATRIGIEDRERNEETRRLAGLILGDPTATTP